VDDIFDIIDPSKKAFNHIQRAHRIATEVGIDFQRFYVVGGYRVPADLEGEVKKRIKFPYLGKIAYDADVERFVLAGKSLLDLPSSSDAYVSIKDILQNAGY
jgi:CO dehydrogenase nickel-insertion accessory protein CooC1